ncbi:DNA-binding protein [Sphaerobacter sp.]|uniref:DNA-binding protein n=1 Tax=Sphaerobacter sp. TaxID=2099654 RepID=UPI001D27524C|nr:DNA-binding protein [Sphaerobacter sp.]MBX5443731.1 DNA-binding protein [Sphaerobacter sp.]
MEKPDITSAERLLRQDEYTLEELAALLELRPYVLESAIYGGELKARMVGTDIVSIRRADVLDWLRAREG